jgi:hypothetical protein
MGNPFSKMRGPNQIYRGGRKEMFNRAARSQLCGGRTANSFDSTTERRYIPAFT